MHSRAPLPRAALALVMLLAGGVAPCACDSGPHDDSEENGTRLKRLWLSEAGGSRILAPGMFWDSATKKICSLDQAREACIAEDEVVEEARYIDSECTKIGIERSAQVARLQKSCTSIYYETWLGAPTLEVPYRYSKIGTRCEVTEGKTTIRLPTGTRPTFTYRPGEGTGRLRPLVAESSDGLRVIGGAPRAFDTLTGEACTIVGGSCRYAGTNLPWVGSNERPESIGGWGGSSRACTSPRPTDSRVVVTAGQGASEVPLSFVSDCVDQTFFAPLRAPVDVAVNAPGALEDYPSRLPLRGPLKAARVGVKALDGESGVLYFTDVDGTRLAPAGLQGARCVVQRGRDGTLECAPTVVFEVLAYESSDCSGTPISAYRQNACTLEPATLYTGRAKQARIVSRANGDDLYIRDRTGCRSYRDARKEALAEDETLIRVVLGQDPDPSLPLPGLPAPIPSDAGASLEDFRAIPLSTYVSDE